MTDCTVAAPKSATKAPARPKAAPSHAPVATQQGEAPPPSTSPTLIVLSLRPTGAKFNGDRIERAQEAGFGWLKEVHLIGMRDLDTGGEIARHVVHSSHEAFGVLKEIQIHIDPESCALMWRAGEELMMRLKKYAVLIGARVCDGMGQPLSGEAMAAIGDHINEVMARRRDEDRLARTVTLPNGEQRLLSELSFAYKVIREAGSNKRTFRSVHFDVPSMHYYEGRELGMRMAAEVVDFYQKHQTAYLDILGILREAMNLQGSDYDKATPDNVASGFLDVFCALIRVGALHLNPAWLNEVTRNQHIYHEDWVVKREERKAEFVARMKAAREAKQLKGGKA